MPTMQQIKSRQKQEEAYKRGESLAPKPAPEPPTEQELVISALEDLIVSAQQEERRAEQRARSARHALEACTSRIAALHVALGARPEFLALIEPPFPLTDRVFFPKGTTDAQN